MGDSVRNRGRKPRANVDKLQVMELAKIGCTMAEISTVIGTFVDTLERRFANVSAPRKLRSIAPQRAA